MKVTHMICCGLDIHKGVVRACLRQVADDGQVGKEFREFETTLPALQEMLSWLVEQKCRVVAMESTGEYWKPVYHVLCQATEVIVGNPADMKRRPGNKTDKLDADWISELLAHDLIAPSFIPPPEIRALRDLTRMRVALVQSRAQAKNRVHKTLEDTNIKLGCVASDVFGKSGRRMLDALIAGERDPKVLSQMALGRMRSKIPQLEAALQGMFTAHHGAIIGLSLEQIDLLERQIGQLDKRIADAMALFAPVVKRLESIPGVAQEAARQIVAEIGLDMTRFGSAGRLASWAGMCPGNNESAGKRKKGKTRKGNRYLRRTLVQCAWATRKTNTYLGGTFRRLQARLGGKKAAVAVGHKILVIIYHLLETGTTYNEKLYDRLDPRMEERRRKNLVKGLERLGYTVSLEKPAA